MKNEILILNKKFPKFNKQRAEIIRIYLDDIKDIDRIEPLAPFETEKYCHQMFGIHT